MRLNKFHDNHQQPKADSHMHLYVYVESRCGAKSLHVLCFLIWIITVRLEWCSFAPIQYTVYCTRESGIVRAYKHVRLGWNDATVAQSMVTIRSPGKHGETCEVAKNYRVFRKKNWISIGFRKCPYEHWLANQIDISVINTVLGFPHSMAAKITRHRYGTKERRCNRRQ